MDTHQRKVPIHTPQFQICEIVHCLGYAPIEGAEEEAKDYFYDTLQATVERIPKHDVLLLLGDFNARVGSNNDNQGNALKRHGVGCYKRQLRETMRLMRIKSLLQWVVPSSSIRTSIS